MLNKEKIIAEFDNYVSDFDVDNQAIKLKILHTNQVANNSLKIAKYIHKSCQFKNFSFTQEDVELAWLIGMLHDIGRFEQIRQYNCFNDAKTVDHALLGTQILFNDRLIEKFIDCSLYQEEAKIIFHAINFHNKISVDSTLDNRCKTHCKIIRDADKIDIFRLCAIDKPEVVYGGSKAQIENSILSIDVYKQALKKKSISYKLRQSLVDDVVVHLAFIWDLNFNVSRQIVEEQGYYQQMSNFKFADKQTNEWFLKVLSLINNKT